MNRMTKQHVLAKMDTANRMLAARGIRDFGTIGALSLYQANGNVSVVYREYSTGAQRTLGPIGTLRESATFLQGMIEALYLTTETN
jgi:hypothetical protein